MGVTLKDVKELSNPSALPKYRLFIASSDIDRWTRVSDKARKKEARRREQEKRDREERVKQRFDTVVLPVHLLRVRCPVCSAFVSMV
jgi:hypothetical protein